MEYYNLEKKEMKEFVITLALFLFCAAFIGHLEVSFSPFYIRLPMWNRVVAAMLLAAAIGIWSIGERRDAYSKGLKRGMEITLEQIKERLENEQ